ncbi:MAG: FKBP-type peptidyl-prolyl cis-trans isomerase [Opitutales bacterium]
MKLTSQLMVAGLFALTTSTALLAQEVKLNIPGEAAPAAAAPAAAPAATAAPATAAAAAVTEQQIMQTFGWFVTARIGIYELKFTPEQIDQFIKGVALSAAGKPAPYDLKTVGPVMDQFISKRQEAALERERQRNLDEAKAFFASLAGRPGVVSLPDGLCYEILKAGTGPNAKATDTVKINYKGSLLDGQVFDSSAQHGGEPLTIALDKAIPGWSEGVQQINKGGKIKLYVPPQLAYGDKGAGSIPPAAAVIFEIEVLDITPTADTAK